MREDRYNRGMSTTSAAPSTSGQGPWGPWRPRVIVRLLARCLVVTTFLASGFSCLAYLHHADWVPSRELQIYDDTVSYAIRVGLACLYPLSCVALFTELQVSLLLSCRWRWSACQVVLPALVGVVGALFAWSLFASQEVGPKRTLLIAGGGLLAYIGVALQLSLWREMSGAKGTTPDFPLPYYAGLVLLCATFLGALRGWTSESPHVQKILDYRQQQVAQDAYAPSHWRRKGPVDEEWPTSDSLGW